MPGFCECQWPTRTLTGSLGASTVVSQARSEILALLVWYGEYDQ